MVAHHKDKSPDKNKASAETSHAALDQEKTRTTAALSVEQLTKRLQQALRKSRDCSDLSSSVANHPDATPEQKAHAARGFARANDPEAAALTIVDAYESSNRTDRATVERVAASIAARLDNSEFVSLVNDYPNLSATIATQLRAKGQNEQAQRYTDKTTQTEPSSESDVHLQIRNWASEMKKLSGRAKDLQGIKIIKAVFELTRVHATQGTMRLTTELVEQGLFPRDEALTALGMQTHLWRRNEDICEELKQRLQTIENHGPRIGRLSKHNAERRENYRPRPINRTAVADLTGGKRKEPNAA